jgi:hypothetical protein
VIAEHRRQNEEWLSPKVGWRYLKDRKTKFEFAMPAKVSSLLIAQLNRVLKELSGEMRRIRTKIALDPLYPFTDECTVDLAALRVADKALASIQLKMIDAGSNLKARAKTRAEGKIRAKRKTDQKGKANTKAKADGKVKAKAKPEKKKSSQARKRPPR